MSKASRRTRPPSRTSSAPHVNGTNSHLCGSIVTESARSMPPQTPPVFLREREAAAVRRVHVEPEAELRGDVGQLFERIDHARRGRARRARHADRHVPFIQVALDGFAELVDADVKPLVGLDLAQVVAPEAEDVHALDEGVVALLGSVDDERRRPRLASGAQPFVPRPARRAVARALEADEVRLGAAARQRPEGRGAVADKLAQPAQDARLDDGRRGRVAPRRAVLVDGGGERVGPHRDGQRRRVEQPVVARAGDVHHVRQQVALELFQNLFDRGAAVRQRLVEERFEFGRRGRRADARRVERARVGGDERGHARPQPLVFFRESFTHRLAVSHPAALSLSCPHPIR